MSEETEAMPIETLVSRYLDVAHLGERSVWLRAEIALQAEREYGVTPQAWASEVGCSASWVRQLRRAARAFPKEEDRDPLVPFAVHVLCASTSNPQDWLRRAGAEHWSVADLRGALKAGALEDDTAERQIAAGERILQRLRRWGEQAPVDARREVARRAREWAAHVVTGVGGSML